MAIMRFVISIKSCDTSTNERLRMMGVWDKDHSVSAIRIVRRSTREASEIIESRDSEVQHGSNSSCIHCCTRFLRLRAS